MINSDPKRKRTMADFHVNLKIFFPENRLPDFFLAPFLLVFRVVFLFVFFVATDEMLVYFQY